MALGRRNSRVPRRSAWNVCVPGIAAVDPLTRSAGNGGADYGSQFENQGRLFE
jgi:hypothetical protein